jgi:hypothetical protein
VAKTVDEGSIPLYNAEAAATAAAVLIAWSQAGATSRNEVRDTIQTPKDFRKQYLHNATALAILGIFEDECSVWSNSPLSCACSRRRAEFPELRCRMTMAAAARDGLQFTARQ